MSRLSDRSYPLVGSLKQTFNSYKDSAKFSSDGRFIGVLKKEQSIGLFDVETAELRVPLTTVELWADQVVFSPDGLTVH